MNYKYGWENAEAPCSNEYLWPVIKGLIPDKKLRILDIGCGNGVISGSLAAMGHTVVALDASEDGLMIAKEKYPDVDFHNLSVYENLDVLGNDYDLAISTEVIEHLYDPDELCKKIFHALKPGGRLILTTPYHGYFKNLALSFFNKWDFHHDSLRVGGHIKFFSDKALKIILERSGFSIVSFEHAGRFYFFWKSAVVLAIK